jgi:HEPN domain-containing protein
MKKPPDRVRDEFVRQWLAKAEEDLNAAKSLVAYGATFLSTVCFHSQQAAEKYLKAFLTRHQVEFPKTHDIDALLDLIAPTNGSLSESLRDVTVLTNYGVDVRYPGDLPGVTTSDAQQAVRLAEKVRKSVLELL